MKLPMQVEWILTTFRVFEDQIYLAGGAVRDTLLNKDIKDYDIFLESHNHTRNVKELSIIADRCNLEIEVLDSYEGLERHIEEFVLVKLFNKDINIDVIVSNEPIEVHMARFSANISCVYLDEGGAVVKGERFLDYERTKIVRFLPDARIDYVNRIMEKFS